MNRRQLLKLLVSGVVGHTLDVDRLLWIPNRIKYFLPSEVPWIHKPSIAEIIAVEQLRILPHIKALFERDDLFYASLERRPTLSANREMRIPLVYEAGGYNVTDSKRVDGNVGMSQQNRETSQGNNQHYKTTTNRGRTKEN